MVCKRSRFKAHSVLGQEAPFILKQDSYMIQSCFHWAVIININVILDVHRSY